MKKTLAKALAVSSIAGAIALAPAPALAYAPTPTPDSLTTTVGAPVSVVFDPVFTPGEDVEITLTGINGATQSLASVGAISSTSITKTADDSGSAEATVTLNSEASGSYELTAVGVESGATDSATITLTEASGGADPDSTDPAAVDPVADDTGSTDAGAGHGTEDELAATGANATTIGLLVGGGALLLGGAAVLIARSLRTRKNA